MTRIAYIALGSNLGDRSALLAGARDAIARLPGTRVTGASAVEETEPLGPIAQGAYLNQMLRIETELNPLPLLHALQRIEREAGRERRERWGPRTLDLDIVLIEGETVREQGLTIPHPGLPSRDFWQRELAELRAEAGGP